MHPEPEVQGLDCPWESQGNATAPIFLTASYSWGLDLPQQSTQVPVVEQVGSLDNPHEIWFGCWAENSQLVPQVKGFSRTALGKGGNFECLQKNGAGSLPPLTFSIFLFLPEIFSFLKIFTRLCTLLYNLEMGNMVLVSQSRLVQHIGMTPTTSCSGTTVLPWAQWGFHAPSPPSP